MHPCFRIFLLSLCLNIGISQTVVASDDGHGVECVETFLSNSEDVDDRQPLHEKGFEDEERDDPIEGDEQFDDREDDALEDRDDDDRDDDDRDDDPEDRR